LDDIRARIDKGDQEVDIAQDHFGSWVRYHRGFREYKRMRQLERARDWPMEIICYIGPSGTGKSRAAREAYPDAYWGPKGKWWDGYCGQETVVVDEMYGHRFGFSDLLQLLDRYPYQVETKGGVTQFVSRRLVFTSNQHPQDWYNAERTHQGDWGQNPLNRRLREYGKIIFTGEVHASAGGRARTSLWNTERECADGGGEAPNHINHWAPVLSIHDALAHSPHYIPPLVPQECLSWEILDID